MNEQRISTADDEALSALLDGALPSEEARRLEERLTREPALAARFGLMRDVNTAVRSAYAGVVDEPLPASVLELLRSSTAAEAGARASNVVPFGERGPRRAARFFAAPLAAAASIALAVGIALGVAIGPRLSAPDATAVLANGRLVAPDSALHDALEAVPSGATRTIADATATPQFTFQATDGAYCRQVDITSPGGAAMALACRRDGRWELEAAAFAAADPSPADDEIFRPATREQNALDGAIDTLIDGAPLEPTAEQALIDQGWRPAE